PFGEWTDSCFPALSAVIRDFKPELLLSQLFTIALARKAKEVSGVRWCCINPAYYFGRDSMRPLEADFAGPALTIFPYLMDALAVAYRPLRGAAPFFAPPPPSFPPHHHHVGPLFWEPHRVAPAWLEIPGAPWVLVTVSSLPQPEEM